MKKILSTILTITILLGMTQTVFAASTKSSSVSLDYNADGKKDHSFSISHVVTNDQGKVKTETVTFPKVKRDANVFTSAQLNHPGGKVKFMVVKKGSTIDMKGSAYTMGYAHDEIYKLEKDTSGKLKFASFTREKIKEDPSNPFAHLNAGYTEFQLIEKNTTEQKGGSVTWIVRGKGSKLVLQEEGYYVLNILAPTNVALRNPAPKDMNTPAVSDQALKESCVFVRVIG